jgi:DNA-binding response OmpR family regulator
MNHSVAIVDANSAHRSVVAEVLASSYTVRGYEHGASAISSMQIHPPKVILVGQKVGAGSGTTFIKDLRRDTALASIPVIFVTDSDDFRIADQLRELGIKDKLVKPYGRNALLAMVSGQLNGQIERGWHCRGISQGPSVAFSGSLGLLQRRGRGGSEQGTGRPFRAD